MSDYLCPKCLMYMIPCNDNNNFNAGDFADCEKCRIVFYRSSNHLIHPIQLKSKIKGQTKMHSFVESLVNVIVGFCVSFFANLIVLPWFGMKVDVSSALGIGVIFTVISIARSYILRRVFNIIMLKERVCL